MSNETPVVPNRATYTIEEAGKILGISRNSAYAAAIRGDLPIVQIGSRKLVPRAALHRLIDGQA